MAQDPSVVTDQVLVLLRAAPDEDVPVELRRVGDGEAPEDRERPYSILYVLDEPPADGSWGDPSEMAELVVQVSSVGDNRAAAQLHQWWMRQVILGMGPNGYRHPIAGDGWKVYKRAHDGSSGPLPEGGLWNAADRFRLGITRA